MNQISESDEGFIYVASVDKLYYELALVAGESLRISYPEAHITLFTHECWVDDRARNLFNNIITNIPINIRAKMWCMARTPYKKTFYCDVDSQVVHPAIKDVFKELDDCDMFFCGSIPHTTANWKWAYIDRNQTIPVQYHGAVCCYNKTDLTIDFMQTWFNDYLEQRRGPWKHRSFAFKEWQQFDMFTLWRMTNPDHAPEYIKFADINIKLGPKRFCATIHDGLHTYDGKMPVVYLTDTPSIKDGMPHLWKQIQESLNNERSNLKKLQTSGNIIEYI